MNLLFLTAGLLQWSVIDLGQNLTLEQDLVLKPKSGLASVMLTKGTRLMVKDIVPLDAIKVHSIVMEVAPCTSDLSSKFSDMTIVDDTYGLMLTKNCRLDTYIEWKDININSPFSESKPNGHSARR
jgi:hypothetical protein